MYVHHLNVLNSNIARFVSVMFFAVDTNVNFNKDY